MNCARCDACARIINSDVGACPQCEPAPLTRKTLEFWWLIASDEERFGIRDWAGTFRRCLDKHMAGKTSQPSLSAKTDRSQVDSEGRCQNMPAGTRVTFLPDRNADLLGTVEKQILHSDGEESFFGNVIVSMDDGRRIEANCWQCNAVEP